MMLAWSAVAVRDAESALMAGLPEGELMSRAVAGLVDIALVRLTEGNGKTVVALVGPGNNGADALYAVARLADEGFNVAAIHSGTVHSGAL
ncbi:MAG: NAD(P)H-hydrate epimerase, partial [Nostocoides sp.]